ncbi:Ribose-phosphate pyrophosphokinase 4 [Lamellibrachia satsuma]|nr:Ribose-phosphate pyrophosphokinase 4 [Lamellibrachia satsuma]
MVELATAVADRCAELSAHCEDVQKGNKMPSQSKLPGDLTCFQRQFSCRVRRHVQLRDTIRWERFPDGFPNLFIEDVKTMAGKDVIFFGSLHSPEVLFEQLSIIFTIPRYLAKSFTLLLPYFPTGTMERVDTEGQIATAKTLATLLSSMPLTARGPAQIVVFDIHALQERFYFSDHVIPRLQSAIPLLEREIHKLRAARTDKLAIAFPDDGAFKRFHAMFLDTPTIVCTKIREGAKRIVKVKDGDPSGCHVIIVDDLIQTGGTMNECIKALRAGGATHISCYVTHAVFPNESWKKFTDPTLDVENFWITDSIPHSHQISQHAPFKLLSLADVIVDILWGYDLTQ